jgi:hypothetical protein
MISRMQGFRGSLRWLARLGGSLGCGLRYLLSTKDLVLEQKRFSIIVIARFEPKTSRKWILYLI